MVTDEKDGVEGKVDMGRGEEVLSIVERDSATERHKCSDADLVSTSE